MLIDVSEQAATRVERKERTRAALLDGTLALAADRGFAALSLREIARSAGIVPTAFYRHFTSLDELGTTLVEAGVRQLRLALREMRRTPNSTLAQTVRFTFEQVDGKRDLWGFLIRERHGGSAALRGAIAVEMQLIERELVVDLSRVRALDSWSPDDLELAADLIVSTVADRIADYLMAEDRESGRVVERAVLQVRLIALGMGAWRP
ncbi:TetR family transcriptional regulator [Nocardia seriolae]|uniref:HTH-type transcriptional repressor FabR n=1 Tax=Nocardia seriolae TaxID=37332 RepID=A0A0B8NL70_9NOCA|nr:TetR family transcriptional regulator [Nocardia seriolae]GEM28041.1 TetR family transcriptional regulator [Nocardia seriolae NBRC 15557]APB01031.1 HTH-type transcriptional repressor FabR [Nocardia seriolae]MTJ65564.1 TetR family transcriptional regulator [Nocardia seriolae]MTJ75490.1 TetR family transcriptional regulator [Nocardia seriolae]MTJ90442.1 TetR family transcriptional regulator [Nocardia seriolae]